MGWACINIYLLKHTGNTGMETARNTRLALQDTFLEVQMACLLCSGFKTCPHAGHWPSSATLLNSLHFHRGKKRQFAFPSAARRKCQWCTWCWVVWWFSKHHWGMILHQLQAPLRQNSLLVIPCLSESFALNFTHFISWHPSFPTESRGSSAWRAFLPGEVSRAGPAQTENSSQSWSNSTLHGNCNIALVSWTTPTLLFQAGAKSQLSCDPRGNT